MRRMLIDTNVIIDVLNGDPAWSAWSEEQLGRAVDAGEAAINPVIYAEVAVAVEDRAALDRALNPADIVRLDLPFDAGWRAGRAFAAYRLRGGPRTSPVADFYIGAHAQAAGLTILTRDVARFRTNFPDVPLTHPDGV